MTDLTLRREETTASPLSSLVQLLKEAFNATPLGLMLGAFTQR
jgi:hypothetical protein